MEKINIIPEVYQPLYEGINSVPYHWAEYPLPDHPDLPQFSRKLIVTGFNSPDLQDQNDERLYISVRQILVNKETGIILKKFNAPVWEIMSNTWSYIRNPVNPNQLIQVDKQIIDDETGEILSVEKSYIKVSTIKYLKLLLHSRKAHLVDLFALYLKDFATAKMSDLDKL